MAQLNLGTRRVQDANGRALYINVPAVWTRAVGVKRRSLLTISIDDKNRLIIEAPEGTHVPSA